MEILWIWLFQSPLSTHVHARPNPTKMMQSICSFHRCLTICKKSRQSRGVCWSLLLIKLQEAFFIEHLWWLVLSTSPSKKENLFKDHLLVAASWTVLDISLKFWRIYTNKISCLCPENMRRKSIAKRLTVLSNI